MKILILNALNPKEEGYKQIQKILQEYLQEDKYSYEWINTREMNINMCIGSGCLACNFKTPGLCIQEDDMQNLYPKLLQAKLLVFLTPISFGSYHSELKKVVDRFLPLKVPVYTIYKGELHHKNRYEEMPNLFSIGVLKDGMEDSKKIFDKLTERNAINMFIEDFSSVIIKQDTDVNKLETKIASELKELIFYE